jgi:hypothetical protein
MNIEDWQYDVANGDTKLGYEEWLEHNKDRDGRQFSVRFSYDTMALTPEEAIETALFTIMTKSGFYVEVFSDRSPDTTEVEGDICDFPNVRGPVL